MLVLGIDTSTLAGSVALVEDDELRSELVFNLRRKHTERLLPSLDWMFSELGIEPSQLDAIGVGIGPGSFTGLRIGLATAKGLALSLNLPLVGISSLRALAWQVKFYKGNILTLLDARKGQVFAQLFCSENELKEQSEPLAIEPEKLLTKITQPCLAVGEGYKVYQEVFSRTKQLFYAGREFDYPRASIIAFLALKELEKGGAFEPDELVPIYIRPSDAELKAKREGKDANHS